MALTFAFTGKQSLGPLKIVYGTFTGSANLSLAITQAEHGLKSVIHAGAMPSVASTIKVVVDSSVDVTFTFSANQTADGKWFLIGHG
jgi:hypothetical protein